MKYFYKDKAPDLQKKLVVKKHRAKLKVFQILFSLIAILFFIIFLPQYFQSDGNQKQVEVKNKSTLHYTTREIPTITIRVGTQDQEKKPWDKLSGLARQTVLVFADDPEVKAEVVDFNNNPVDIKVEAKNFDYLAADIELEGTENLAPGYYKIKIETSMGGTTYLQEQNFTWGVLAFNPNKSIYKQGDLASLAMAVLDETGKMVCDASLLAQVTKPNGEIVHLSTENGKVWVNSDCEIKDITSNPDFEAELLVEEIGRYEVLVSSQTKNGTAELRDFFEVESLPSFEINRQTATRIYPLKDYPVEITVLANQDFAGTIKETIPTSFRPMLLPGFQEFSTKSIDGNLLELSWTVSLKKGETIKLGYAYDAPDISPERYLIGPLELKSNDSVADFEEIRQWQIASDAIGDYGSIWYLRSTTASAEFGTTGPTAEFSSATETQAGPSDRTTALAMTTEMEDSTHTSVVHGETSATDPTYQWLRTFVSPTLAAQTLNSGAEFRIEFGYSESAASANAFSQIHVYQWREGTGYIATLFDGSGTNVNCGLEPDGGGNDAVRNQTCVTAATGSNVTLQAGDQIAVEVWSKFANTVTGSRTSGLYYGGNQFVGAGTVNDAVTLTSAMGMFAVSQSLALQTPVTKGSNWFLRSTTASSAFGTTGPTAEGSSVTDDVSGSPTNKTTALAMTDEIGTSLTTAAGTETIVTNPTYLWMRTFLTPKLAAQTIATGTTFRIEAGISESNAAQNVALQTNIFRWRESDGSRVNIIDGAGSDVDCGLEPDGSVNNQRNQTCVTSATGSDVDLLNGDQIGVEYWVRSQNAVTTSYTSNLGWEGDTFVERGVNNDSYTSNDVLSMFSVAQTLDYETPTIDVSGNAYESDGSTKWSGCDGSTARISLVINGGTEATTTCHGTTGAYTFTGVSVATNDPVSVFYNTTGSNTEKGVTTTVAANGTSDITANVSQDVILVTTETGVSSITNANLNHCQSGSPAQCANVPYAVASSNVTGTSGVLFRIANGKTYAPGGNLTTQGSGGHLHLDDNSVFTGAASQTHTIGGGVTIDSGATLTAPSSGTIAVAGNWTNSGTFTHNSGTISWNGGSQTSTGSTTFYNLSVTGSSARTVTFTAGSTTSVANNGTLTLSGASAQLLTLQSSSGSDWNLQVSNTGTTVNVDYVSVSRSNASGYKQIDASDGTSVDGGNNTNWLFAAAGPTNDQLMRHGSWFNSSGVRQFFTY
jgi:hypothetical protein